MLSQMVNAVIDNKVSTSGYGFYHLVDSLLDFIQELNLDTEHIDNITAINCLGVYLRIEWTGKSAICDNHLLDPFTCFDVEDIDTNTLKWLVDTLAVENDNQEYRVVWVKEAKAYLYTLTANEANRLVQEAVNVEGE